MNFIKAFYLTKNTFILLGICVGLFSFGLLHNLFFIMGKLLLLGLCVAVFIEIIVLFRVKQPLLVSRKVPIRLSNGDTNAVTLFFENVTTLSFQLTIQEDFPEQFQLRNWKKITVSKAGEKTAYSYSIFPKTRGLYHWGDCRLLIQLFSYSLVAKKSTYHFEQSVACYPSFDQFNRIPLKTIVANFHDNTSNNLVRKIGQSLEFEQIKEYSREDDYRHINWKASAKRGQLMLNQYQEERSQDIYCILDMGRSMKMPFYQQSLLDYAINASLALSKTVISMQDKAGIVGLSHDQCQFLPARKDFKQFGKINDFLYNIKTDYLEADYELLYKFARVNIKQRSLLVIFTNFDSVNSLHRQMPYLKALSKYHLLLVVFFENAEVAQYVQEKAEDLKEIYSKTIAQSLLNQHKLICKELHKYSILSLLVQPQNLSMETINKFVEIKRKNLI